jgi:hypothetical protein
VSTRLLRSKRQPWTENRTTRSNWPRGSSSRSMAACACRCHWR